MDSTAVDEQFICTETVPPYVYEPNIYETIPTQVQ